VIILLWLIAATVLLAFELHHLAFFAMFGTIGCLGGAAVAAAAPRQYLAQGGVAFLICAIGILFARPYVSKAFHRRHDGNIPRGVQGGLVGTPVVVLDDVTEEPGGHVRLLGENWLAVSGDGQRFRVGDEAVVQSVSRTTLTVVSPAGVRPANPITLGAPTLTPHSSPQ
jgi:membrane protein implicated in regulation of membrane protease activity